MTIDTKQEFSELITEHHARIYAYIHSLLRDLHDADEVMQRTTLVMWRKFKTYDRTKSFVGWASGVARYEVSNFFRQRGRDKMSFSDELAEVLIDSHAENANELDEQTEVLAQCMKKLSDSDRQLMQRCYQKDHSVPEIAAALGRSTQSIHNSLRRIRELLYQCVSKSTAAD